MYAWRRMTAQQREEAAKWRRQLRYPRHSPPHFDPDQPGFFHLSAACFNHAPIIGYSPDRIADFEETLLATLQTGAQEIRAWCVLPNHWHALAKTDNLKSVIHALGRLHGRFSKRWNLEDEIIGRKCWFCCSDRRMRSEGHFWATMNYIHHNPVHHGYVDQWQDWPYSSAAQWLEKNGTLQAARIWKDYPVQDYGKGWDEPEK